MQEQEKHERFLYRIAQSDARPQAPEGLFISGSRETRVFDAYRATTPAVLRRQADNCCQKHPGDPTISIIVSFTKNLDIQVAVNATHPCGLNHVAVFIADQTLLQDPLGNIVRSYTAKLVDGEFIDASANSTVGRPFNQDFKLQTPNGLIDESFFVAAVAISTCGTEAGTHDGPFLIV
jgi:hypothetical protein